ncbi:integrase [Stutzerimonas stutzeri]|nr:integrase [Stutzerimonas stutzeri]
MGIPENTPGHNRVTSQSQLSIPLASPWHFRKQGVYQLRVRPRGSHASCTVSLRTTDRPTAMKTSKLLQSTLRAFHLDNPDATWEELREHLRAIAEDILATPTEWERLEDQALIYADWQADLHAITRTGSLTVPQAKAAILGGRILGAAQERLHGRPQALVDVIDEINRSEHRDSPTHASSSLSVSAPQALPPLTFGSLAESYLKEHGPNVKPSSMKEIGYCHGTLSDALGDLDMRTHTRADLIALRDTLSETRKPLSVNNLLTKLATVLSWAVNNDLIPKAYTQNLKFKKGAESTRKAFTQDQIKTLMAYANGLPADSWKRWALTLGVITGARLNEYVQLTKEDVRKEGGVWVIDINDNNGKELKTAQSMRLVPLTDGAYGFDLEAFLGFVENAKGNTALGVSYRLAGRELNLVLRDLVSGDDPDLTLHSLRHSLASLLQAEGVPVAFTQAILGQSSGTLAYETYGSGVPVEKLAVVLMETLPIT